MARQKQKATIPLTTIQAASLRRKWGRWLERLLPDLSGLFAMRLVFHELDDIVSANPVALDPPTFYNWARNNYIVAMAIGLRRFSDSDTRSVSLRRLLEEVYVRNDVISRSSLKAQLRRQRLREDDADDMFDIHIGRGRQVIPKTMVRADIARLKAVDSRIRRFVNKRVAHHGKMGDIRRLPTFGDVAALLRTTDRLLTKYNTLIRADGLGSTYATPNYDWRRALQEAWLGHDLRKWPPRRIST